MSALAGLGRRATYRGGPSWFDLHPLPEGWRTPAPPAPLPPLGEEWQWVVTDGRRWVLAWGTVVCDLGDPRAVALEALDAYLAAQPRPAHGLLCAARLAADPGVIGVVDGRAR